MSRELEKNNQSSKGKFAEKIVRANKLIDILNVFEQKNENLEKPIRNNH